MAEILEGRLEPIKLRPHHLRLFEKYCDMTNEKRIKWKQWSAEQYCAEHAENISAIFELMLHGNPQFILVPSFDDICHVCNQEKSYCSNKESPPKGYDIPFTFDKIYTAEEFRKAEFTYGFEWFGEKIKITESIDYGKIEIRFPKGWGENHCRA